MAPVRDQLHVRVEALDLLRLVAVLGVVFYHFAFFGPAIDGVAQVAIPGMASYAKYGYLGVPVFFIISGFVIAYSAEGRTWSAFAIARFSRIYPTFIVCMTLTFAAIVMVGAPNYQATFGQWLANLSVASTIFGQPYMDSAYWSLAIELVFYGWVALLMAAGVFPRKIDAIILIWFGITFANELTLDLVVVEKLFLADDSGFFAIGLLLYEHYRGRRDPRLYGLLALAIGTSVFQALHRMPKLGVLTGSEFNGWIIVAICLLATACIYYALRIRRVPIPAGAVLAIGGLTYPLYLLHQQLGYTILMSGIVQERSSAVVIALLVSIMVLSWAVWRYVERPAQRWTRTTLTYCATRLIWPSLIKRNA